MYSKGIDFGKAADDYARFRAGFPAEFFDRIAERGLFHGGDRVLDLGTGTGTLSRGFAQRGCTVTALDLSLALLTQAKRLDREAGITNVTYIEGHAERIELPDTTFDLVTAGQCWHWFDGIQAAAEAHRVLRARGRIIIAHFDWISLPGNVVEATEELMGRHNPQRLLAGSGVHPRSLTHLAIAGFKNIETASFDVGVSYSHEAWRGRVRAHGGIGGTLSPSDVAAFDADLSHLLKEAFPADPLLVPHRVWYGTATRE